jgi:predicted membrane protein
MKKMENKNSSDRRFLFGLFLIVAGVFWIFVKLNLIPPVWSDVLISWQMLLIGIGIFSFIGGNKTAGTVLIVIGSFFLIDQVLIIPYTLRQIGWPLLIIGIGLALLLTHRKRNNLPSPEAGVPGAENFDDFVIFGGREIFINSKDFPGGKITSIFGGAEYDLRQASLSRNGAVVDCVCIFGGSGFKVPPDWTIRNEVTTIFGAFTDKRGMSVHEVSSDPSKTLIIKGFSAFGGVEVKYH